MSLRSLIPLFAFLALMGALAFGLTRDPRILPSELIEKPFPDFTLDNLDNDKTLDGSLFEGRISLVNVFGSWCRRELARSTSQCQSLARGTW